MVKKNKMALEAGDLEMIPEDLTIEDCYESVHNWHRKNWKTAIREQSETDQKSLMEYLSYFDSLKPVMSANKEDMKRLFNEIISGLMQWSYHKKDKYNIKLGAYAEFALQKY
ncbi:MAG: hypothetical protein V1660_01295 [archaeon]